MTYGSRQEIGSISPRSEDPGSVFDPEQTNAIVLTLRRDGRRTCFYTDAVDLDQVGSLEVQRATVIEFNHELHLWEVKNLNGEILFQHASRAVCLIREQESYREAPACGQ